MTANRSILFIGHSHIICIAQAARGNDNVEFISLIGDAVWKKETRRPAKVVASILGRVTLKNPDAICLSIGGNEYHLWSLSEHPVPFSVGDARYGCVPQNGSDRQIIPYELMKEHFEIECAEHDSQPLYEALYEAFPTSKRYYLDSPPPVSDWRKIKATPGGYYGDRTLGPAPDALRLKLFQIQREVLRNRAKLAKAVFVSPRAPLVDEHGFLTEKFYDTDPTHGNKKYGRAMLKRVSNLVGKQS